MFAFIPKRTHIEAHESNPASYVGAWASAGGYIHQEFLPDGRYIKRRGAHAPATGRYQVSDTRITLESETGAVYTGEFTEGALRQAEMIFYKIA